MEKSKATRSSCDLLPQEIWSDVLIRLPVKSILRCRSVCKPWHSLISNPNFISGYELRNLNNRVLVNQYDKISCSWSYRSHDESLVESGGFGDFPEPKCDIVGSCNGLICLYRFDPNMGRGASDIIVINFFIWNPTIRKVIEVPSLTYGRDFSHNFYGFGFDPKACDYKLLWIGTSSNMADRKVRCKILDVRKGVWRLITPTTPPMLSNYAECYLNGALHWVENLGNIVLLSFDLSDEVFREMKMPFCDGVTQIVALGGLIHVIAWKKGVMFDDCSVWVMKEYGVTESWTKVFDIDREIARVVKYGSTYWAPKLYLLESGEVFMLYVDDETGDDGKMYDKNVKQFWDLYNVKGRKSICVLSSVTKYVVQVVLYKESLALL